MFGPVKLLKEAVKVYSQLGVGNVVLVQFC